MSRLIKGFLGGFLLLALLAFSFAFLSPRPPLTINPETLAGDGAALNYCELPLLDGQGLLAQDIPKGNTPGCAYDHFPLPVLEACHEPLSPTPPICAACGKRSAESLGTWSVSSTRPSVITTAGSFDGPNATAGEAPTIRRAVSSSPWDREFCGRTSATMTWDEGILNFHAFGWGPLVVRRYLEGEALIWEYADGSVTRMERICTLPEAHRTPQPRGLRLKLL